MITLVSDTQQTGQGQGLHGMQYVVPTGQTRGCVTAGWYHPAVLCFPASSNLTAAFRTGNRPHLLARHGTQPGTPLLYLIPHLHTLHTWSHSHCCWSEKNNPRKSPVLLRAQHPVSWPPVATPTGGYGRDLWGLPAERVPLHSCSWGDALALQLSRDVSGAGRCNGVAPRCCCHREHRHNRLGKAGMGQAQDIPFHSVPTKEKRSAAPSSVLPKPDC